MYMVGARPPIYERKGVRKLTHALELLFELGLVLAVGDPEVVIRVSTLVDAVGRSRGPDGHDRGRALGSLALADFLDGHHSWAVRSPSPEHKGKKKVGFRKKPRAIGELEGDAGRSQGLGGVIYIYIYAGALEGR